MKHILFLSSLLAAAAALGSCSYLPDTTALAAGVGVTETRAAIVLEEASGSTHTVGFMFYPGGFVDPHAYLPWLSSLAASGIPVVVAKAPGNLAVISTDAGLPLKALVPAATGWVIGGHSLGGAMAAWSVFDHPDAYLGIVFLAAYPATDRSLASWPHPVLSLSAEHDGLATPQKITDTLPLLPTGGYTVTHQIPGGNHGQFGSYGAQEGDGTATITADAQHLEMVTYIKNFFTSNGW